MSKQQEFDTRTQGALATPITHKLYGSGFPTIDVDGVVKAIRQSTNPADRARMRRSLLTPIGVNPLIPPGPDSYGGTIAQLSQARDGLHLVGNVIVFNDFYRRGKAGLVVDVEFAEIVDASTAETKGQWNVTVGRRDSQTRDIQIDQAELAKLALSHSAESLFVLEDLTPGESTRRLRLLDDLMQ